MARLAVFRSMHSVRAGERHRPTRAIAVAPGSVAYLGVCEVELGNAWSGERLSDVRRRMEAELGLLRSYATEAECKAAGRAAVDDAIRAKIGARLAGDARFIAVETFVAIAREAEGQSMTLVYDDEQA